MGKETPQSRTHEPLQLASLGNMKMSRRVFFFVTAALLEGCGNYDPKAILAQTMTAVAHQGKDTTFVDKDGYTRKEFEVAQKATVLIRLNGVESSGFFIENPADKPTDDGFMVSAGHAFPTDYSKIKALTYVRPHVAGEQVVTLNPSECSFAVDDADDMTLIRIPASQMPKQHVPIIPLPFIDDYGNIVAEKDVHLLVGFTIQEGVPDLDAISDAFVTTVQGVDKTRGIWATDGVVIGGYSGGLDATLISRGGKKILTAVGIANDTAQNSPLVYMNSLRTKKLVPLLRKPQAA